MKRNFSRQDIKLLIDEYTDIIEKNGRYSSFREHISVRDRKER